MTFSQAAGEVLRRARLTQGLTLRDVETRSAGQFKPSVVGGYERAERAISLERFCELAELYGALPDRLLAEAMARVDPEGRSEVVLDLTRLPLIGEDQGRVVAEFVHRVKRERRDFLTDVLTLRSGDLEALSLACGQSPGSLIKRLHPAVKSLGEARVLQTEGLSEPVA